ncbi:MAG: nicotinate-nucleotide--dimethylbenzimidazole phosphoribosyltransferase, partial [Rhodoblastus sp.]|nr:nicotinate-nucleotide--dimethylbenzimidazole phosphoribosyltransferase [Rhodoblastus sp.]
MSISGKPFDDFRNLLDVMPQASEQAVAVVRAHDAQLTKPPGSLGRLEEIVEWLAAWQAKTPPTVERPTVVVFAGNHGVTDQGVSPWPREVTKQMVANFGAGGAAVNQICATFGAGLKVFEMALEIPTKDITQDAAMTEAECAATMAFGMEAIAGGIDLLCVGEMGIGNTTPAAAMAAALAGEDGGRWAGPGTGLDREGVHHKA